MTPDDLLVRIERLRRSTRNSDILAICDAVETLRRERDALAAELAEVKRPKLRRDDPGYMREYMANRRRQQGGAKQKAAGT